MNRVGKVTLHCKKCNTVLATRETVMLAKVPPSSTHLAVREGMEEQVEAKLSKLDNEKGGKSTRYCPYIFRCRECDKHVANLTKVAGKLLICFKIENIDIFHNGKKITANKLSEVRKELEEECGIEVVNVTKHAQETGRIHQSRGDSKSMVYCDTSGLTHTSREIDFLTRLVPRDYQRELFLSAMRGNTLVYLPTGSGKTLIAAMVMSCMEKLNPSKVMVFLVDRVPLAYQQSEKIKSQLTGLTVETLVGEMESPQNGSIHQRLADNKIDVLILTHQIFLNFLAAEDNPPIRLSDVSVLVLDEAHHCSGHHPYNKIMEYYKTTPNRFKPVVLGLSASPAGELEVERTSEKLKKLLENLDCKIAMPIESDLLLHVNIPNVIYETSDRKNTEQVILQLCTEDHIEHLIKSHLKDVPDRQRFEFPVFSSNFRGALRKLIDSYHSNKKCFKALTVAEHAMHLLSVVEFCEVLGNQYAVESLKECVHRIVYAKSPKDCALQTTLKDIKIHFDHSFKMLTLHSSRQSSIVPGQGAVARGPYKIEFRYDEIEDFIIVDCDSNAGVIKVFLSARHPPRLYRQLEDQPNFVHPALIDEQDNEDNSVVSSSEDDSETEGLSTDEEYPDVITADFHDASPDLSRNLTDNGSWERASDFHNGENAVSQCFTYCVTIPFNELVQLRRLLTTVEKRFHKSAFYCRVKESYGKLPDVNIPDSLPFDVKYAAGSVLSFHPLVRGRVPSGKFGRLLLGKSSDIAIAALEKLSKVLEKDKFCDPGSILESLLKQNNPSTSGMFNRLVPGHCALIKRAVITPTRLLFYPPEVMVKNRVLRNYDTNDFLCVSIRDEDLSKMSAARGNIDDLLDGMKLKLDEGLEIAGQRFQFLGSSNSQLRNHSCWFVGLSSLPDDIRRWMGKFTNIK